MTYCFKLNWGKTQINTAISKNQSILKQARHLHVWFLKEKQYSWHLNLRMQPTRFDRGKVLSAVLCFLLYVTLR